MVLTTDNFAEAFLPPLEPCRTPSQWRTLLTPPGNRYEPPLKAQLIGPARCVHMRKEFLKLNQYVYLEGKFYHMLSCILKET